MDLQEIEETFEFLDDWEDKYRFIIDLGKDLPVLDDAYRNEANLVRGCQSQVWLVYTANGKVELQMDSDAHIVRGLIAIILAALNGKSPADIVAYDAQALFARFDLLAHLSPTRGNGLMAMLDRIRSLAAADG